MVICKAIYVIKVDENFFKVKYLCTAEVRTAKEKNPINRHYTVTVDDDTMQTTYRTTKNPTIVTSQYFVTKHLKSCTQKTSERQ